MTSRPIAQFLAAWVVVCASFLALSTVDKAAEIARYRETAGFTRGVIVDQSGIPLAQTVKVAGKAGRHYRFPDLSNVIGYRDPGGEWHGLEKQYGSVLTAARARRDWQTFFLHLHGVSAWGGTVRLTLDSRIQHVAETALGKGTGAVVVLDPRTGAVQAMVNKPACTPATLTTEDGYMRCRNDPDKPLLNRATQLEVAPGSAFKIVTLSAALDTHTFTLASTFSGADAFGPSPYFDNVLYPSNVTRTDLTQLTLAQALAFSDNFTFAHIGLTLGSTTFLRYAHRYFMDRTIPFDIPVSRSTIAGGAPTLTSAQLAQSSFGAEIDRVSPLQMALITSTVADGGVMMAPHLVQDVESPAGQVLWHYRQHPLDRVMSREADYQVKQGMAFVVNHGSGYKAQIAGVQVCGKTGTAASSGSQPNAWFIAFAPMKHPVAAVAVLNEFTGEGFEHAAPIARRVLVAALQERGYKVK